MRRTVAQRPRGESFCSDTRPAVTSGQIAPAMRARRRLVVRAVAPTLTALETVRIALEITVVVRVTTRTWVVANTRAQLEAEGAVAAGRARVADLPERSGEGEVLALEREPVPPTAVPATRPTTVTLPPQTTRLGVSAIETPVGSRGVTNERSRLRVEPAEFVATARKW